MVSPDCPDDEAGATQDAASAAAPRFAMAAGRAELPVYRPRNYRARAVAVAVLAAALVAVIVWLVLALVL